MDRVTTTNSLTQYSYPPDVTWNTCFRLVKIDAWADIYAECGISLTDACDVPGEMSEDSWQVWKLSVRGISSACATLVGQLEGCCEQRGTAPASKPSTGESTLNLIPYSAFATALLNCAVSDATYTLPFPGSSTPMVRHYYFHLRELCARMMFTQAAIRPYLKPVRTCLASALYTPPNYSAPGAYYEPEAYFYDMCVASVSLDPNFYSGLDQNTTDQFNALYGSGFLHLPGLSPI